MKWAVHESCIHYAPVKSAVFLLFCQLHISLWWFHDFIIMTLKKVYEKACFWGNATDGRIAIAHFSLLFEKLSRKEVNNDIWEKWLIMKFPSWQQNDEATYFIQKSLSTSSLFDLMQFSILFCAIDVCEKWINYTTHLLKDNNPTVAIVRHNSKIIKHICF